MIFVDSSVWIDYFRGYESQHTETLDQLFGADKIVIGDLVLTEVLQGFDSDRDFEKTLDLFTTIPLVTLGGRATAVEAAKNYRRLRAKGCTVRKTIDTIIATRCILSDFELLHNDRDFLPFQEYLGLKSVI